ncbi:DUF6082 family protein [Streptomyces griseus]|uniref:DUF6082 family protein n=1 Tax=Streptomyces griseus TaxID=1911 RepID=UPI0036757438
MKVSTAILWAGVSVGVAQLVQRDRQHKQHNDVALSLIQIEWLSRASGDEVEAAFWTPEGVDTEQYRRMLSANRMFCQLSLRFRLGLVTAWQLELYADKLMEVAAAANTGRGSARTARLRPWATRSTNSSPGP